ncbi:MAG: hypothetical protein U1E73_01355 [Planctomycetota bacterium]
MNLSMIPSLLLPAALLVAGATAQNTRNFATTRTQNYGVNLAGGSTTLRATAAVTTPSTLLGATTLAATISNTANVRLFGYSREAAAVTGTMTANHAFSSLTPSGIVFQNTSTGTMTVRLGGYTVLSGASFNSQQSGNLVANVFPGAGVSYGVNMLGIGITVAGNVSARANYSLTPTVSFSSGMAVDLTGPVRSSAVGSAGASVSVLGASAGVTSTLTYANTNGTANLHVTPDAASGTVAYTVQQIRLQLQVFASFLGMSSTLSLFDVSTASQSGTLNLAEI